MNEKRKYNRTLKSKLEMQMKIQALSSDEKLSADYKRGAVDALRWALGEEK